MADGFNGFWRTVQAVASQPEVQEWVGAAWQGLKNPAAGPSMPPCAGRGQHRAACASHGIGVCIRCAVAFCSTHGLVYLADVLDPSVLVAQFRAPQQGVCHDCLQRGLLALDAHEGRPAPRPPPEPAAAAPRQRRKRAAAPAEPQTPDEIALAEAYRVLGLTPSATLEEARRRRRELAQQYHPDQNQNPRAADFMARINAAADRVEDALRKAAKPR